MEKKKKVFVSRMKRIEQLNWMDIEHHHWHFMYREEKLHTYDTILFQFFVVFFRWDSSLQLSIVMWYSIYVEFWYRLSAVKSTIQPMNNKLIAIQNNTRTFQSWNISGSVPCLLLEWMSYLYVCLVGNQLLKYVENQTKFWQAHLLVYCYISYI